MLISSCCHWVIVSVFLTRHTSVRVNNRTWSLIISSWAATLPCHNSVRDRCLLSRLWVSSLADDDAEGRSWWWYGVDWWGGTVWWRGQVLWDAGEDHVLHWPGVVINRARLISAIISFLLNFNGLVALAGTTRILTGIIGFGRLLCISFSFRFGFRFRFGLRWRWRWRWRWRLMLVHWCGLCWFFCVDWCGEARAGSEGKVCQQGRVLGVIGSNFTGRLLLAQNHAHLPVVAIPGWGGRAGQAGQNNKASFTLKKENKTWLFGLISADHLPWVFHPPRPPSLRQHHVGNHVSSLNPCGKCY